MFPMRKVRIINGQGTALEGFSGISSPKVSNRCQVYPKLHEHEQKGSTFTSRKARGRPPDTQLSSTGNAAGCPHRQP